MSLEEGLEKQEEWKLKTAKHTTADKCPQPCQGSLGLHGRERTARVKGHLGDKPRGLQLLLSL